MESPVLEELGVDAAVAGVVDVFEHDAVGEGRGGVAAAAGDVKVVGFGAGEAERQEEREGGEGAHFGGYAHRSMIENGSGRGEEPFSLAGAVFVYILHLRKRL